jgi:prepilin-type processing-associated H-X9-DG protein
MVAEKTIPVTRHGTDGGDNERWNNSGWDEDTIRFHFVPVSDFAAPALTGIAATPRIRTPAAPSGGGCSAGPHPGGINAMFGDGSVKFIKYSVDASTFRRLCVIDDGEVISADSY